MGKEYETETNYKEGDALNCSNDYQLYISFSIDSKEFTDILEEYLNSKYNGLKSLKKDNIPIMSTRFDFPIKRM